ncbi:MAG: RibD family protein [Elainella sp. Prado103]|nr:RibD family protein [Elainella sp. Prado103]
MSATDRPDVLPLAASPPHPSCPLRLDRPYTTLVLAMSADGKIADRDRAAARFGSPRDKQHLETQIAQSDAVLFGAGTLRAYGTTLRVTQPNLLALRAQQGQPSQPIQIVCSQSGQFAPQLPFFQQPVPRWLLSCPNPDPDQLAQWNSLFERLIPLCQSAGQTDWHATLQQLQRLGIDRLAITGGSELAADLFAADLIDEFWLTICPLLLGGIQAPSPIGGWGRLETEAARLTLLSCEVIDQEVFLHYRRANE